MRFDKTLFLMDRRGNVAMMFAIALVPIVFCIGAAIDYATAVSMQKRIVDAADAATLAGARAGSDYIQSNPNSGAWRQVATDAARNYFTANLQLSTGSARLTSVSVSRAASTVSVSANYSGAVPTAFMSMAGIENVAIDGHAAAEAGLPAYSQINFVIDVSQSMGIGATAADQTSMLNNFGCSLACHYPNGDYLNNVRASGALLRIDAVKNSIKKMLQIAKTTSAVPNQFQIGVYTYSNDLTEVLAPTTDLEAAIRAIDSVDLTNVDASGGTNGFYSLRKYAASADLGGDGGTPMSRRVFTVVATDGVEDGVTEKYNGPNSTYVSPDPNFTVLSPNFIASAAEILQGLPANTCDALKAKKHSVVFLNTEYVMPSNWTSDGRYVFVHDQLLTQLPNTMANCASSPLNVYVVTSPTDIDAATTTIFQKISNARVHLTQ